MFLLSIIAKNVTAQVHANHLCPLVEEVLTMDYSRTVSKQSNQQLQQPFEPVRSIRPEHPYFNIAEPSKGEEEEEEEEKKKKKIGRAHV